MHIPWVNEIFHVPGDPDARRRGRTVITIVFMQFGLILLGFPLVLLGPASGPGLLAMTVSFVLYSIVFALVRTGQVSFAAILLVFVALLSISLAILGTPGFNEIVFYLLLPIVMASLVLSPWQVWGVLFLCFITTAIEASLNIAALKTDPLASNLLVSAVMILSFVGVISFLGALVMRRAFEETVQAQSASDQANRQLTELNMGLEHQIQARTADLQAAFQAVQTQANERQSLLDEIAAQRDFIREMNVPVLPVSERTLVMPLVGDLDHQRLIGIQTRALTAVEMYRATTLLIDITGVSVVDTYVAQGIIHTIQSVRLLGAHAILIGVRPEVAQAMVSLGIDLNEVHTAKDLASVLDHAK